MKLSDMSRAFRHPSFKALYTHSTCQRNFERCVVKSREHLARALGFVEVEDSNLDNIVYV